MTRIIGLSGSLRAGSYNTALLRAAAQLMPPQSQLVVQTIHGIPLYDADEEANGVPAAVAALKEAIAEADALLIATPEYNNSIPGALKNAVDWLSRPPADNARVWRNKPLAMIGATPGGFGTILSQNEWLPVWRYLQANVWFGGRLLISKAHQLFNEQGELTDDKTREQIRQFLAEFVNWQATQRGNLT